MLTVCHGRSREPSPALKERILDPCYMCAIGQPAISTEGNMVVSIRGIRRRFTGFRATAWVYPRAAIIVVGPSSDAKEREAASVLGAGARLTLAAQKILIFRKKS